MWMYEICPPFSLSNPFRGRLELRIEYPVLVYVDGQSLCTWHPPLPRHRSIGAEDWIPRFEIQPTKFTRRIHTRWVFGEGFNFTVRITPLVVFVCFSAFRYFSEVHYIAGFELEDIKKDEFTRTFYSNFRYNFKAIHNKIQWTTQ